MFTWSYEGSVEVDLSLQEAWDFYTNPTNFPKWDDRFDPFVYEGTLKVGSKIRVKIKNKPIHVEIEVTEVRPYHEYKCRAKSLFSTEQAGSIFQEISPQKTRITLTLHIVSLFTPLIKKRLPGYMEKVRLKYQSAYIEAAEQVEANIPASQQEPGCQWFLSIYQVISLQQAHSEMETPSRTLEAR